MTIAITEAQRKQLEGILATHIHNMRTAFIAAHGTEEAVACTARGECLGDSPAETRGGWMGSGTGSVTATECSGDIAMS
jgi:hypothetical protein